MKYFYSDRIEPSGLSRRDKGHGYEFFSVTYQRSSEAERLQWPSVLYFRNIGRNIYGLIDYDKFTTSQNIRAIAAKLIKDARFRGQFLADPQDDEMLTANWR